MPSERSSSWLKGAGKLFLTLLVTWFILDQLGVSLRALGEVDPSFWRPQAALLASSVLLLLVGYLASALAWGGMLRELGGPRLGALTAFRLFFAANLGRYIPGKVWQLAGMALLARGAGVAPVLATSTAVLGQGFSLLAAGVVGSAVFLQAGTEWRWLGLVAVGGGLFLLGLVSLPSIFRRGVRIIFGRAGGEVPAGLEEDHFFPIRWTTIHAGIWCIYGIAFWLLGTSMGLAAPLPFMGAAFAAAYLAGYLALFAPAGLGVREGVMVALLQPVLGDGPALGLAVVSRVWTTAVEAIPGVMAGWATLRHRNSGHDG